MTLAGHALDSGLRCLKAPDDDLCLSFANTLFWRGSPTPTETLQSPADLRRWLAETTGSVPATPPDAATFAAALALREAIFRLFACLSAGRPPDTADLVQLNEALAAAPPRTHMALAADAAGWLIPRADVALPALLAPVLWSAGDLVLGPRAARVRQCANPACGYLFLDDSKSGNRRWCDMSSCGNRAKAHRHYLKRKQARAAG